MKKLQAMRDEELAALAQKGDAAATDELFRRYKRVVRARARRYFLAGGETEDLIQEGMVGLYQAVHAYDGDKERKLSFKNFAYLCITRRITDAVRRSAKSQNDALNDYVSIFEPNFDLADEFSAEDEVIRSEDGTELLQRMSKALSAFEFRIFVMYMDGMSYAQIAESTKKDVKSVDNALRRGKKKLLGVLRQK